MDSGSSLSNLLYKEIESARGGSEENQNHENGLSKERSYESGTNKTWSTRPKPFFGHGQGEKRGHNLPAQNRSTSRGYGSHNWKTVSWRNQDSSIQETNDNCEMNRHGSAWKDSPHRQASKLQLDGDETKSQGLRQRTGFPPKKRYIPGFGEDEIKELLKKDSNEILMDLTGRLKDFSSLINQKLSPEVVMLVVQIFEKTSTSSKKECQAALLSHSVQPGLLQQFSSHAFDIVAQNTKYNPADLIKYFENLYTLYKDVVDMMPTKASDILRDHLTRAVMALDNLKLMTKVPIPLKLDQDFQILLASVESLVNQRTSAAPKKSREKVNREWQPGIDFRLLSVHPLPEDLLSRQDFNLCPVVIEGPYKSVEHYLDVQFNLMREDFLMPLREGITNYVEQKSSKGNKIKRIESVRFYEGVVFLDQTVNHDVIATRVEFGGSDRNRRRAWSASKRFMYGSLLCFTSDLFESIMLGMVVDGETHINSGIVVCELIGEVHHGNLYKKEFIMAESEVYFESYQHVLKALQNFNEGNFPLQEYIINVSPDLHLPRYLSNNPHAVYNYNEMTFSVNDINTWPNMEQLKVNESQLMALHSALTKKCAVIQGPPGTGKTHIGLLIANILLQNSSWWRTRWSGRPILVVCFTNHALDQFLEGMLSFTDRIVRIGNQSKNEKLNEYNLRAMRDPYLNRKELYEIRTELNRFTFSMTRYNDLLNECRRNNGIISLGCLYGMNESHASWFRGWNRSDLNHYFGWNNSWSNSNLVEWLLTGAYFENFSDSQLELNSSERVSIDVDHFHACSLEEMYDYINQLKVASINAVGYQLESIMNIMVMHMNRFSYMKNRLAEPYEPNVKLINKLSRVKNLNSLQPKYRWHLYKYWVSQTIEHYQRSLKRIREMYGATEYVRLNMLEEANLNILSDCDIVGMTTTAAARHQALLRKLGCKIVIVEEAAEVMESHIVTSLSSSCGHLILIGDHKQLRPSPAVYRLAKDYHLDISLFERLLINGVSHDSLKIQHRMRPDIADLIFPAVYPLLENHPSVMAYDNIVGLRKNLYFITHSHLEERSGDDLSKKNPHEAKFLIALCKHLILQGYNCSQITILTAYLGQMYILMEERDKHTFMRDVRVTAVDNFQGEENDIILLSLVRNNEEGKMGFLASENRTCVALSRAKKGLYIMGNIDMLAEKNRLWSKIKNVLQEKEAVGTHLTLQCLKHPEQSMEVSKAEDFNEIPKGGCKMMCEERMNCGHICKEVCHAQGHDEFTCYEPCDRVMCIRDHRCEKECWETCGNCMVNVEVTLPCGHIKELPCHIEPSEYKCEEVVNVTLPDCGHTNEKQCYVDLKDAECSAPCDSRLPCGHVCTEKCHVNHDPDHLEFQCTKPCTRTNLHCREKHLCQRKCYEDCGLCTVLTDKKLPNCDHYYNLECSVDPWTINCDRPCGKKFGCGHKCLKKCKDYCGLCHEVVEKEIPGCKHKMSMNCYEVPLRSMCKEKCMRNLSCGHICTDLCGIPCTAKNCDILTEKTARAGCGHDVRLFCCEVNTEPSGSTIMERCEEACNEILECSHKCKGTCGKCLQGRIHIPCQEKCARSLICGHKCKALCSEACPPCMEKCIVCCEHSGCKNGCGKPCSRCQEKCGWQCEHETCKRKCSDICNRPPCNEPCRKQLNCGHDCIGFCGEKCPDLCRLCNAEEVDEILAFLGVEVDENARFVLLPDCGHVFESTGLNKYLFMDDCMVKILECPRCKVPIQQAYRYGCEAKLRLIHIMNVKCRVFGKLKKINRKVMNLTEEVSRELIKNEKFDKSLNSLGSSLQNFIQKNRMTFFDPFVLNSLQVRTESVQCVFRIFNKFQSKIDPVVAMKDCINTANMLIRTMLRRLDSISIQERRDFEAECMRFQLLMGLRALENKNEFKTDRTMSLSELYEKCRVVVEDTRTFPKDKYKETYNNIKKLGEMLEDRDILYYYSELINIVPVIDLHQGHWYKCPNGHIFTYIEYDQVMKTGKCHTCGENVVKVNQGVADFNNK